MYIHSPMNEMKREIQLEQYRRAYSERNRSANQQWQMIGLGNPLIGGVLVAAITAKTVTTSLVLSCLSVPICFFLLVLYRKEVYFENLFSESIEVIETEFEVKHVQYDTFPQKPKDDHYITTQPGRWQIESISLHTIMTILFLFYNIVAAGSFIYFVGKVLSFAFSVPTCLLLYPCLYFLSILTNKRRRIEQSFMIHSKETNDINSVTTPENE